MAWLGGFFSGLNTGGSDVDLLGQMNLDDALKWVHSYCMEHPGDRFMDASIRLATLLLSQHTEALEALDKLLATPPPTAA